MREENEAQKKRRRDEKIVAMVLKAAKRHAKKIQTHVQKEEDVTLQEQLQKGEDECQHFQKEQDQQLAQLHKERDELLAQIRQLREEEAQRQRDLEQQRQELERHRLAHELMRMARDGLAERLYRSRVVAINYLKSS